MRMFICVKCKKIYPMTYGRNIDNAISPDFICLECANDKETEE